MKLQTAPYLMRFMNIESRAAEKTHRINEIVVNKSELSRDKVVRKCKK